MITILLVDDELPIIMTLRNNIPWQQFGVYKILTAMDGIAALEELDNNHVDLLITDIRMPNMDGLTLLKKVRQKYPAIHCILLTAYGEFEYVKKAISLGVENYLLKPFQKDEMEESIELALDHIYRNRKNSQNLFPSNVLIRWSTGTISSDELGERAGLLGINIYLPFYCAACVKSKNEGVPITAFRSACLKELAATYTVYTFQDNEKNHIIILGGAYLSMESIQKCFQNIAVTLNQNDYLVIIGEIAEGSENLPKSYKSVLNRFQSAAVSDQETHFLTETKKALDEVFIQDLLLLFQNKEEQERKAGYAALVTDLYGSGTNTKALTAKLVTCLSHLFSQEFKNDFTFHDLLQNRTKLLTPAVSRESYIHSATELLEYSYLHFLYCQEQFSPIILDVIEYIHQHYSDSLSIKEFSAWNKMSTDYLGYLFKKETGMFFNNYLTQYRICCSVPLLKKLDWKIADISSAVGFSSTSYYISCFRKQTCLSPIQYRTINFERSCTDEECETEFFQ